MKFALLLLCVSLYSCLNTDVKITESPVDALNLIEPALPEKEEQALRIAIDPFQPKFNPQFSYTATEAQLYANLFESLLSNDPQNLQPQAGLASSWELSEDKLTYVFQIRTDARFSDGSPISAQTFVDSWLNLLDPANNAPFASLLEPISGVSDYLRGRSNKKPEFFASGERELSIKTDAPSPHLLSILSHHSLAPIHPSLLAVRDWGDLTAAQIPSSGAYRLSQIEGDKIFLELNPFYHDKENVGIKTVEVVLSDDPNSLIREFNTLQLDWINSGVRLEGLNNTAALQVTPRFITTFFYFRNDRNVWNNEKVRRAMLLLLPLEELRQLYRQADARLVPTMSRYPLAKGIEKQDKEQAFKLLEAAGYPEGANLPKLVVRLGFATELSEDSLIARILNTWKESLALEIELQKTAVGTSIYEKENNYDFGTMSWIGDYADPMAFLQLWLEDSSLNIFGYGDEGYDKLLQEANSLQAEERLKKLSEAEEYLLQSAVLLPVGHSPAVNVIDIKKFQGWQANPLDIHLFKYLTRINIIPAGSI